MKQQIRKYIITLLLVSSGLLGINHIYACVGGDPNEGFDITIDDNTIYDGPPLNEIEVVTTPNETNAPSLSDLSNAANQAVQEASNNSPNEIIDPGLPSTATETPEGGLTSDNGGGLIEVYGSQTSNTGGDGTNNDGENDPPSQNPQDPHAPPTPPCSQTSLDNGQKAASLFNNAAVKAKVAGLTTNLSSTTTENSSSIATNNTTNAINMAPTQTGMGNHVAISPVVSPSGYTVSGAVHTHYDGLYSCLSVGDLYALGQANAANGDFQYLYSTGSNGSYVFVVTDPDQLASFMQNFPASDCFNPTDGKFIEDSNFQQEYDKAYDQFHFNEGYTDEAAYDQALAAVLNAANAGVSLYKEDADGNFKELKTEKQTQNGQPTYVNKDCN